MLETEINRYYSTYASTVRQRLKDWETQHRNIKERIQKIEKEIIGLRNRQRSIKNIMSKI